MTALRIYFLLFFAIVLSQMSFADGSMPQSAYESQICHQIDSLYDLGISHPSHLTQDTLMFYCDQAIALVGAKEFHPCLAKVYLAKGRGVFADFGPRDVATRNLLKGLQIYTQTNDTLGIANSMLQLGLVNYDMEQYENAAHYFKEILENTLVDQHLYAVAEYLLALSYSELKLFDQAKILFEGSRKRYGAQNAINAMRIQMFIGKMLINEGKPMEAIAHLKSINIPYNDPAFLATELTPMNSYLSKAYNQLGDYKSAIYYGKLGFDGAKLNGASVIYFREANLNLHLAYKALAQYDSAYYYLNSLNAINSKVANSQVAQRVAELRGKFEYDQLISKQNAAQTLERNRAEMKWRISLIVVVLVTLFALLFFYQKGTIKREKQRSDQLLLNILPEKIAEELKENGTAKAKHFNSVCILFSDFKSFTAQSAQMTAGDLVEEIHAYFVEFDTISEKYGVEKIKTIGDAYMAAGGIPVPSADAVKRTILAGLEMQDYVAKRKIAQAALGKMAFEMRVGIHTGPVVAGIVGKKKFQYDVWGDTVNTASRMESCGQTGKVNISNETYQLISRETEFEFEDRGLIEAKGKGKIRMWFCEMNPRV